MFLRDCPGVFSLGLILLLCPGPPPVPSPLQDMAGGGGSLAVSPSIIATSTAARANALKAAVTNYRLKQLRTYLNTLPLEQRPQNLQELREMLRNSSLAQVAGCTNVHVHVTYMCTRALSYLHCIYTCTCTHMYDYMCVYCKYDYIPTCSPLCYHS